MDRITQIKNLEEVVSEMLDSLKNIGYTGKVNSFRDLSKMIKRHYAIEKIKYVDTDFGAGARLLNPDYTDDCTEIPFSKREAQGRLFNTYRIVLPSKKNPIYWSRRGILEQFHPTFNNVIHMDDFSNGENEGRPGNSPYFEFIGIGNRFATKKHLHDVHFMNLLGHEFGHLLHFCDEDKWTPKISKALGGKGEVITCFGSEFYAELFATALLFPPEEEYLESKQDILEIGNSPTFLQGIVNLSRKRKLGISNLLERLSSSRVFKEEFPNYFALQFKPYVGNLHLLETNIFPEEVEFSFGGSQRFGESRQFLYIPEGNAQDFSDHLLHGYDINPRIYDFPAAKYKGDPRLKRAPFFIETPYFINPYQESFFETLILSIQDQPQNPKLTLDPTYFKKSRGDYPLAEINSCGQYRGRYCTGSEDEKGENFFLVAGKVKI